MISIDKYPIFFEQWLPITGFGLRPGYYVSDSGRIYDETRDVYIEPCYTQDGYQQLTLRADDGKRKNIRINRVVLSTFNPIENMDEYEANHLDAKRDNNYLYNLDWRTKSENNKYMFDIGNRDNLGENNPNSKLSEQDVIRIHELRHNGLSTKDIISYFGYEYSGTSRAMINRVLKGETWKYLYDKYNT